MIKSYHIRLEEKFLKKLKQLALDGDTSVQSLILKAINEKYHLNGEKTRTPVRKKFKSKRP